MKPDKRFESKMTFYSFVAIIVVLIIVGSVQKCNAQMNIPLLTGTLESGDVYDDEGNDPFTLTGSYFKASTTLVRIEFKRRQYERINLLTYPIDSIEISDRTKDGFELLTLWPHNDERYKSALKIEILSDDVNHTIYIYYPDQIFYFTGKVL